ncbi:MAG: hypothetical protein ACLTBV_27715 [Enterocloster bolteae]
MITIRQAASMFQLSHPDVRVELIEGPKQVAAPRFQIPYVR